MKNENETIEDYRRRLNDMSDREIAEEMESVKKQLEERGVSRTDVERMVVRLKWQCLVKMFFARFLPRVILDGFQIFLIVNKAFDIGPFAGRSWWLILSPMLISAAFGIACRIFDSTRERV